MTIRDTTMWVKTDRIVPHPANANKMPPALFAKLKANIDQNLGPDGTVRIPPIIVRTLEISSQFQDLHAADRLQILDGEHRWKYATERGEDEVEVKVWSGVSDRVAELYLATLNPLRGTDDKARRRTLIANLSQTIDPESLAAILPENLDEIVAAAGERAETARKNHRKSAESGRKATTQQAFTIFVTAKQHDVISGAIRLKLRDMDREHQVVECREGEALAAICSEQMDSER